MVLELLLFDCVTCSNGSERDAKPAGHHARKSHPASLVSLLFVVNNATATFSSIVMQHFDFVFQDYLGRICFQVRYLTKIHV